MAKNKQTDRTEKILKDTFVQTLKKMPIEKIQVKTLCNLRGFDRSTFYRHYEDIYDLLSSVEDDLVDELSMLEKQILDSHTDINNPTAIIPKFIFKNKHILNALFIHGDGNEFFKKFDTAFKKIYLNKACDAFEFSPEINQKELENTIKFLSRGYYSIYFDILNNTSKDEITNMIKIASKISLSYLNQISTSNTLDK